ncbi:hypothetical protein [Nonomuraea dietziae]|uniref:hypothetical protein n=1 Tax=Nonomuraea dietziae TaxID=65515 RepID=UPI0031D34E93
MLMPDMTSLKTDAATLAAAMAKLATAKSVYRLPDRRLVISPFKAEGQSAAWWTNFMKIMKDTHGITVAFVPVFLNFPSNAAAFAPISYGFSNWGNRSPAGQSGIASNIAKAHELRRSGCSRSPSRTSVPTRASTTRPTTRRTCASRGRSRSRAAPTGSS